MRRLFRKKIVLGEDLLKSQLFDELTFYRAFSRDIWSARQSITIESPYLTTRRAQQFAKTFKKLKKRGVSIRINTREPRHHPPRLRLQSLTSIEILKQVGVNVYVCRDMRHRKLAIIDNAVLWDGSLNILSQARSKEVMRRTNSAVLCRQMTAFTGINNRYW